MTISENAYSRVAVVGAGTIGASWAALFLAHGLHVTVSDPRPDLEEYVTAQLTALTPTLAALGLPTEALAARLVFEPDVEKAVADAEVVQESGPDDLNLKQELFARLETATRPGTLLLSSTSGIRATDFTARMADPGRVAVGHPFNPPHLVPLVEIVPGEQTEAGTLEDAAAFYRQVGKQPLILRREIPGFVANRLQSALFREAVHLVTTGVVSLKDLDTIVTSSIGLRWAAGGPFLTFNLGGGPGGFEHFLKHLGPGMEMLWQLLGKPSFDEATIATLSAQEREAYGDRTYDQLGAARDRDQLALMAALRNAD
ncbi:ketoreductase RED1 [Kitasatospora sp. GP30]|uniref:3-hydroxyacyl-CoA dehydrogenase NAD-binding domain-containing protein n=1 Tax=Kitasatospora sp. GP30 TaxID=3035084 RepID=UPI000C70B127|nr:3-hydroxyacyl-CoA dehydrogenase NAD-binding domain-containing protein [Kitasatospora sp. GP30]MDH6145053.1 ketoreductase RED1 [Kitasatospora sp. GP30]